MPSPHPQEPPFPDASVAAAGSPLSSADLRTRLLVPAAGILIVSLAVIVALLVVAALRENRIAFENTRQTVQSLLAGERTRWEQLALDVTWWQDAYETLRGDVDPLWADDNIGIYYSENFGTTLSGAAGPDDRVLYAAYEGARGGEDILAAAIERIGGAAAAVRAAPVEAPETVSGFFRLGDDVYIFGLGALTPEYPTEAELTARRGLDLLLYLLPALALIGAGIAALAYRVLRIWGNTVDMVQAREQTLQAIFDGAGDGIIVLDDRGCLRTFNRAAQAIFGYDRAALAGRDIRTLVTADATPAHAGESWLDACLAGRCGDRHSAGDLLGIRADGSTVPLAVTVNCLQLGSRRMCVGVLHDMTERLGIEAQLRDEMHRAEVASRAKSAFLANISHELRTPLNAIIGFAEFIRDGAFGPLARRYRDYAGDIHASGQHLLRLIEGILDLTLIEHGRARLDEETFDAGQAVDEALRLVEPAAQQTGVALVRAVPDGLPALVADRLKVRQILVNLLSNAVKFTDPGGRVTAGAGPDADGGLAFTVTDTGIGMDAEMLERAFQAFAQAEESYARRRSGAGLGLTLSRQLAELHGGTLTLASTPGAGTTATVRLPPERLLSVPATGMQTAGGAA